MSRAIGPVSVLPAGGQEQPFAADGVAPSTRQVIDEEVRHLIEECYAEAVEKLRTNRERLDRLARTLLKRETPDEDEAYAAAGVIRHGVPAALPGGEAPADGQPVALTL
jgi:cell division protease FtsH